MNFSLEQSIKEKLRSLTKEREISFFQLWINLVSERFLVRLSRSSSKQNFIIKGGALLARYIPLDRETQDLDFFTKIFPKNEINIKKTLNEICSIDINDSFNFEMISIKKLEHSHMKYSGYQVKLIAHFGKTKTQLSLDLGFGDVVEPILHSFQLLASKKGPLFEKEIQIQSYPQEFIFAEKLETVIFRDKQNSRMKDFYDLYQLIQSNHLNDLKTEHAIKIVFNHRSTPLNAFPLLIENFPFNEEWRQFTNKINKPFQVEFENILGIINLWLEHHTSLCKKEYAPNRV